MGSPGSSPSALWHCLGVAMMHRCPRPLTPAPTHLRALPEGWCPQHTQHIQPPTENTCPPCVLFVRGEAKFDLPKQERQGTTGRWAFRARAARPAAVQGCREHHTRSEAEGEQRGPILASATGAGLGGGWHQWDVIVLPGTDNFRTSAPGADQCLQERPNPSGLQESCWGAAAADTGSSGGLLHTPPHRPCNVLFTFPLPRQCPDLTCVS